MSAETNIAERLERIFLRREEGGPALLSGEFALLEEAIAALHLSESKQTRYREALERTRSALDSARANVHVDRHPGVPFDLCESIMCKSFRKSNDLARQALHGDTGEES